MAAARPETTGRKPPGQSQHEQPEPASPAAERLVYTVPEKPLESTLKSAREPNRCERLLTPKETANFLRLSLSWLAKGRMRGDGPPFVKPGRAVRYRESDLLQWLKARARRSTSEY
jgi:predicted DNA-binding transcriptional regulator AlpA